MERYTVEKTKDRTLLTRKNVEQLSLVSCEGLCAADPMDFGRGRDVRSYSAHVIDPGILNGKISDGSNGPYDDRKMRYHLSSIADGQLRVGLGFSHYEEYKAVFNRRRKENRKLRDLGIENFEDPFAFFARAPGVTAAVISSDGAVILGKRTVEIEEGKHDKHRGLLQSTAGHLEYRKDPSNVDLIVDVTRELGEFGILQENIRSISFVGLFSDPEVFGADLDFDFVVSTDLPAVYFASGLWKERATEREHGNDLFVLPNYSAVQKLLQTGNIEGSEKKWDIVFSTRAALKMIRSKEMRVAL